MFAAIKPNNIRANKIWKFKLNILFLNDTFELFFLCSISIDVRRDSDNAQHGKA